MLRQKNFTAKGIARPSLKRRQAGKPMDYTSRSKRSFIMSKIRSKGTGPERKINATLAALGIGGYRRNFRGLPGTPDFWFPKLGLALFYDGDFWHPRASQLLPEYFRRKGYWRGKLVYGYANEVKKRLKLRLMGIKVVSVRDGGISGRSFRQILARAMP